MYVKPVKHTFNPFQGIGILLVQVYINISFFFCRGNLLFERICNYALLTRSGYRKLKCRIKQKILLYFHKVYWTSSKMFSLMQICRLINILKKFPTNKKGEITRTYYFNPLLGTLICWVHETYCTEIKSL